MIRSPAQTGMSMLVLMFCAVTVAAQAGASLEGTIKDQHRDVVASANVQLVSIASGRCLETSSDAAGKYSLTGFLPGPYQLSVSHAGFALASRRITLRKTESRREDFVLVPGIVGISMTVTVAKGNARSGVETPQMLTVADASRIEDQRPSSTLQAIELAPNLAPVNANPALQRPRLRGLASNRLLIILDGERLNNARSDPTSGVSPSLIDVTELESVEAVSGAGSSLYGSDAMAGIINLVTPGPERSQQAHHLGLRLTSDVHSNGWFRRGSTTANWSEPTFAFRFSGSLFRETNYHSGAQPISVDEVVGLGNLATAMGNTIGNGVGRTYAVWSLPSNGEIPNNQAHGFNDRIDLWIFPSANQNLRYRQLNSQHGNLGFSFITPPFDQRTQFNSFRRLDKYGLRYEGRELTTWLPRLVVSTYRQKYSFPDDTITSPIMLGSSWIFSPDPNAPQNLLPVLTGNRSLFTAGNFSDNKNSVTTYGLDVQATFASRLGMLITSGVGYVRDSSADEFSRTDFVPPFNVISSRASTPNSIYRNWGWFNLLEYEPRHWLRLTGGLRMDNWKTEARATSGFPLGVERTLLEVSLARMLGNPGQIDVAGTAGIVDLINGSRSLTTRRTVVTGNAGITVRLPRGINPYFRWGSSYREPGVTERYLLRDFGDSTFSVLVIPNTALQPERGHEYNVGVKVQRSRWNVSVAYFANHLAQFVGSAFAPALFVPADPSCGLNPISPAFPFHGVLYVQRTNTARARIEGFEGTYEASLPLGHAGTLTPFGAFGLLKGTNLTPDQSTLKLIAQFYNRADTALPLRGSTNDAPLSSITPLRAIQGIRFDSSKHHWFGEYAVRYQSRVKRADPLDLSAAISTQYGTLASLNAFATNTVRVGYSYRKESYRVAFTGGIENLTNRLYFEHFQTAPAPGRSFVIGTTLEWFNLLRK
jgi:outer membrane receptor protein involved in Fe transport